VWFTLYDKVFPNGKGTREGKWSGGCTIYSKHSSLFLLDVAQPYCFLCFFLSMLSSKASDLFNLFSVVWLFSLNFASTSLWSITQAWWRWQNYQQVAKPCHLITNPILSSHCLIYFHQLKKIESMNGCEFALKHLSHITI
jgi:hypothetical protein